MVSAEDGDPMPPETASSQQLEISSVEALFSDELATSIGVGPDRYPENDDEVAKAGEALAKELSEKLTMEEHEKILLDIHGVIEPVPPAESVVTAKLRALEAALAQIHPSDKAAYERAHKQNREYVENDAFRLHFLRSEEFDPKAASERMVLHFQVKDELFVQGRTKGDEILGRNVSWDDLDETDQKYVKSGYLQVCPKRDVAGRTIFFLIAQNDPSTYTAKLRATWYMFMSALLSDFDVQEKGAVLISLNFDKQIPPLSVMQQRFRAKIAVPVVFVANHYCYRYETLHPSVVGFQLSLAAKIGDAHKTRQRLRTHYGSMANIAFKLQTFGIPMDSSPVTTSMLQDAESISLSVSWHLEWIERIRGIESVRSASGHDSNEKVILVPRRFDVLLGKTKDAMQHPGTVRCQHLVRMHLAEYEKSNKREKTDISNRIVSIIHDSQGRFLKKCGKVSAKGEVVGSWWVPVENVIAREKISYSFRNMRKVEPSPSVVSLGTTDGSANDVGNTAVKRCFSQS